VRAKRRSGRAFPLHGSGGAAAIKVKADAARGGMTNNKNDPLSLLCSVGSAARTTKPYTTMHAALHFMFSSRLAALEPDEEARECTNFLMLNS
jgi:hypothetical protein